MNIKDIDGGIKSFIAVVPSLPPAVERVIQRSADRVSKLSKQHYRKCMAAFTHPDIASLRGKRVKKIISYLKNFSQPDNIARQQLSRTPKNIL
jgi:hypothetical protein